jgi:ChrR Cupin-like domain
LETSIGAGRYGKEAKAMRRMLVLLVLTSLFLSGTALAQTAHVMVQPDDMKWGEGPPSLPSGAKFAVIEGKPVEAGPFTMRLRFPAGYKIPAHSHPAIEHVTVLSGVINFGMGDKFDASQLKPMPTGSYIVMGRRAPLAARLQCPTSTCESARPSAHQSPVAGECGQIS